jgi:mono/diheme cytochrome c family protein
VGFLMEIDDLGADGNGTTVNSMVMKKQKVVSWGGRALAAACLIGLGLSLAKAGPPDQKAEPQKSAPRKLTGAELYSMHCNRCHPERYPTERTAAQWKTIMLHMQVRANIPGSQAKLILQYLQENSGR